MSKPPTDRDREWAARPTASRLRGRSADFYPLASFMSDIRPQGYLGRFFPQRFADLGLPPRIPDWGQRTKRSTSFARRGEDAPGNLLVGDESHARWLALSVEQCV